MKKMIISYLSENGSSLGFNECLRIDAVAR